uniref:Uncharacterized protein n=1 Tax=Triticum urartu TaxID=4572 RepID=A0A8R7P455_TRIUA
MDNIFMENLLFPWCANMMCRNISIRTASGLLWPCRTTTGMSTMVAGSRPS